MGKRKQDQRNLENIEPQHGFCSQSICSPQLDCSEMKTRSKKGKSVKLGTVSAAPDPVAYPTAVLLQEIANTASEDSDKADDDIFNKSPLSESSCNERTPEKHAVNTSPGLSTDISITTRATPTANLKILCDAVDHDETVSSESSIIRTVTGDEPVTPTTNLKMLITAASPEIRSLELSKSRLFTDDDEEDEDQFDDVEISKKSSKAAAAATRKQKSLGILCRRFMSQFEENPPKTSRIEVCLDELAAHLGTERRRIYDIVNVLESVEIMSRRAKNRYLWHGKTNLNATLVKLKYFAETEMVARQLELVRELEVARLYGRKARSDGRVLSEDEVVIEHPKYKQYMDQFGDAHRKERSLGVMSQKFLMLFLTGRTKTINLDMAAKILLGDPMVETKQTNSQFKTKIRRLYDIANILASINLICKVHVTELRGRKPAFSYIGPDVEQLASLDEYQYLKGVEVARPGRTTLDMKMEELKRKMDAHVAEQAASIKQVPPVTVQAPDLEEIKQTMTTGKDGNLSRLAAEHAATKKDKQRAIAPAPALPPRPFVVIQGLNGGATSVVTTSQAPNFMDGNQSTSMATSSSSSQEQYSTISLLPLIQTEGNQYVVAAPVHQQSPISLSLLNTSPAAGSAVRQILPHSSGTTQTLTLYTPPSKQAGEPSSQQKRAISQGIDTSNADLVPADGTFSAVLLTKSDNEYFISNKKAKTGGDSTSADAGREGNEAADGDVSEETIAGSARVTQPQVLFETPMSCHMSAAPVPVVYSTPSGQHAQITDAKVPQSITGTQITFLASPVSTPAGTPVDTPVDSRTVAAPNATSKQHTAIRQLLLSPK